MVNNLKNKILEEIGANKVNMRPRVYFTLQVLLVSLIAFGVLVLSVLLCSFIFLSLRISGHQNLLGFGPRGFLFFFQFFPWTFLLLDLGLLLLLQYTLHKFQFTYRSPLLYVFIAILAITISASFILDRETHINDSLLERADRDELPTPLGGFYRGAHRPPPPESGVCKCIITSIHGNQLQVALDDDRATTTIINVIIPKEEKATTTGLKVGDEVIIAGIIKGGVLEAFGLHKIN